MRRNYFKNPYGEMWIEDGIFYVVHAEGNVITKDIAISQVYERFKLTEGITYPMFIDSRGLKYVTKDAREYLNKGDGVKYINAGAFLINSSVQEIIGNYFLKFTRPPIPARLFTRQEKALLWLQQFKNPVTINQPG